MFLKRFFYLSFFIFLAINSPCYAEITVVKIIDGDSLKISTGQNVRLIGIDAPESSNNKKTKRDSFRSGQDISTIITLGKQSKTFLQSLDLIGKPIILEFDVRKQDQYGRLLAYVYFLPADLRSVHKLKQAEFFYYDDKGRVFLNATMVKSGYASPLTVPPDVKHADLFSKLFKEAQQQKRGLWRN